MTEAPFSGNAEAWRQAMDGLQGGRAGASPPLHLLGTVDSTNLRLRGLAQEGAPPFTVVVADAQRAGRGRGGRGWDSPAGRGLWISVLLPPPREGLPGVTPLAVGVAAAEAVERAGAGVRAQLRVGLKWPNDLLLPLGGPGARWGKAGGILCEVAPGGGGVVAGVGINLITPSAGAAPSSPDDPGRDEDPAGSETPIHPLPRAFVLSEGEEGDGFGVEGVRRALAMELVAALRRWADPPPFRMTPALRAAWEARDVLQGGVVEVREEATKPGPGGVPRGPGGAGAEPGGPGAGPGRGSAEPGNAPLSRWRAAGVSDDGALRLRGLAGESERLLLAGRVRLVEPGATALAPVGGPSDPKDPRERTVPIAPSGPSERGVPHPPARSRR